MGIGVYVEMGGINTLTTPDSIIDLYAAFDQAESQNKSDKYQVRFASADEKRKNYAEPFSISWLYKRTRRCIAGGPRGGGDRTEDI